MVLAPVSGYGEIAMIGRNGGKLGVADAEGRRGRGGTVLYFN